MRLVSLLALVFCFIISVPSLANVGPVQQLTFGERDIEVTTEGNKVYWIRWEANDNYSIFVWDGVTQTQLYTTSIYTLHSIDVSNGKLIWATFTKPNTNHSGEIWYWDGLMPFIAQRLTDDICGDSFPRISYTEILWKRGCPSNTGSHRTGLMYYNLNNWNGLPIDVDGQAEVIHTKQNISSYYIEDSIIAFLHPGGFGAPPTILILDETHQISFYKQGSIADFAFSQGDIVWSEYDGNDYEIVLRMGTQEIQITNDFLLHSRPSLNQRHVVWTTLNPNDMSYNVHYWDGNLWNGQLPVQPAPTALTNDQEINNAQLVNGELVVWKRFDGTYYELFYATIVYENCTDGIDNDGDAEVDLDDAECKFLQFPIKDFYPGISELSPYTGKINSVMDHQLGSYPSPQETIPVPPFFPYPGDGYVTAFNGETAGDGVFVALDCKSNGEQFLLYGNYRGSGNNPFHLCYDGHPGIDYNTTEINTPGIPVYAAASGEITLVCVPCSYGTIEITHSNGLKTRYLHLASATVAQGQYVFAGEQIGVSGDQGVEGSPHLHFEVRDHTGTINLDPYGFMGQHDLWISPCQDGIDNDGDMLTDLDDAGCLNENDLSEEFDCSDGIDNDDDGTIDWDDGSNPNPDSQCTGPNDQLETGGPSCGVGFELIAIIPVLSIIRKRRKLLR